MHETKMKVQKMCALKDKLTSVVESEMSKSMVDVNTGELGAAIDMIKDLAEAEEKCWKACYYKKIIEAMEEAKEEEELMLKMMQADPEAAERMGYDRYRYSSGRYAPKGKGHETSVAKAMGRAGYIPRIPYMPIDPDKPWPMGEPPYLGMERMGYPDDHMMDSKTRKEPSRYDKYQDARRYYTQTGTDESRKEMNDEAKEYLKESIETMRDIWTQADPELQQKMQKDILALAREMGM